jgi:hypothetical protein
VPGRDRNGHAPRPDAEAGTPLWADPVQRIADGDDGMVAGREPDDFDDAPTEIWGPLPPDPAVADRAGTGAWRPAGRPDRVQESGGYQSTSGPAAGGFATQPWALDPRLDGAPESWAARADRPELTRGHAPAPGVDAPTDPWPLADRYHAGPVTDEPAESPWSPMRGRNGHLGGDAATPRRRAAGSEQSHPDLRAVPGPVDPPPSSGGRRALREDRLVDTGEYSAPSSSGYYETPGSGVRSEYGGSRGHGERPDYGGAAEYDDRSEYAGSREYGEPDPTGRSEYGDRSPGHAADAEYAAPPNGARQRALEPSDDVVDAAAEGEWHTEVRGAPLTREFSFVTDADPPAASDEFSRPGRGRHAAPEVGDVTPETMPLQVFVPPADPERPTGRHRRPD